MWNTTGFWTEGSSSQMAAYDAMILDIHVLLVDHEIQESPMSTAKLLELCQYKVCVVEVASSAMSILISGKAKFDVVMVDINSPDGNGFKLLQLAVNMGLQVIVMSYKEDMMVAMRAMESGALMFIKKPAAMEVVRYLWQHVLRERTRSRKQYDRIREVIEASYSTTTGSMDKKDQSCPSHDYDDLAHEQRKRAKGRRLMAEWTDELHRKFMDAVARLGEGRCFPKEILEEMKVEGLTRMQVASHLQKCRNDSWRSPDEKRAYQVGRLNDGSNPNSRRFGTMPRSLSSHSPHLQTPRHDIHEPQKTDHSSGQTSSEAQHEIEMTIESVHGSMEAAPEPTPAKINPHSTVHQPRPMQYDGGLGGIDASTTTAAALGQQLAATDFYDDLEMSRLIQSISGSFKQGISDPSDHRP